MSLDTNYGKYYPLDKNITISAAIIDSLHGFLVIITDIALQKHRIAYITYILLGNILIIRNSVV